ncbi:hypothetical protein AOQ84DRAFT_298893 [Glonium stellatum]|uniref:methylated diphthine methylhydrolase n=1 Tax=Glonium stellatum TaxID=574774 RepID=A0A8E2JQ31_9PEZI|nr:hypothetical protein AOQ84DRAFT_298893 [Glonium stellatum]
MASINPVRSLILDLPPSCVEFWPHEPEYAIVGTYHLEREEASSAKQDKEEEGQQRSGSLVLLKVAENDVAIIQTLATPFAILDVHFCPLTYGKPSLLGVASSTGSVALYELKKPAPESWSSSGKSSAYLSHFRTIQYFKYDVLVTAFMWHPIFTDTIGLTLSSGEVVLCSVGDDERSQDIMTLYSHDLEAWTLAFQRDGLGLLSGGDDSTLRFQSLPSHHVHRISGITSEAEEQEKGGSLSLLTYLRDENQLKICWTDQKIHGAGVTAILPLDGDVVVTGSYDDHIRIVQAPSAGRRTVLAEMNLGGGVWRLKVVGNQTQPLQETPDGTTKVILLVSCMHAGTRIVEIVKTGDGTWSLQVLAKFEEHKSMNYGSDFQPVSGAGERLFVSTSFYDRLLCLWRF